MPDIRDSIRQAESSTPHVEYSSQVVRPAQAPVDKDNENYQSLWRQLGGERRAKIEQDYRIWKALNEHVVAMKALVVQFPIQSQLKRRLGWSLRPPSAWVICGTCKGSGDGDIGYCRQCQGDGYVT